MPGTNLLVLVAFVVYLGASFLLWHILLKEPPPRPPPVGRRGQRWPARLAQGLVVMMAGAACGAGSLLVVATIVNAGKPGTLGSAATFGVWVAASLVAAIFVARGRGLGGVVARTCLALGLQGVLLPLATLISFLVAGARLAGSAGTSGERTAVLLGVRLAGSLSAVGLGIGAFCVGMILIVAGDIARRRRHRPRSRHIRTARAGALSSRSRGR